MTSTYARYPAARESARRRREEFVAKLAAIKLGSGCVDCGYRGHAAALEFDHLPGTTKLYSISTMWSYSWPIVEAEIAKCDVVCANCHRVRSSERGDVGAPRIYDREDQ